MPLKAPLSKHRSFLISQTVKSPEPSNSVPSKIDFWRDPAWQSVGVIVALLTIFISLRQSQKKSLSYSITSKVNILDIEDSIRSKVQISFESKPIQDLYLIIIKFLNSGNTPIQPSDYYRPVNIVFNGTAEILSIEVLEQSPENLGVVISHTPKTAEIPQILLNQKDSFVLKMLVTNFQDLSVDGRIAGIKSIEERDSSIYDAYLTSVLSIMTAFLATMTGLLLIIFLPKSTLLLITTGLALLAISLAFSIDISSKLKRKK